MVIVMVFVMIINMTRLNNVECGMWNVECLKIKRNANKYYIDYVWYHRNNSA